MKFRPVATPLVTVDPYFSIWSFSDNLYDDVTRFWTGRRNSMSAGVFIDGRFHSIMGKRRPNSDRYFVMDDEVIPQVSLEVKPLSTTYVFENDLLRVKLYFMTPLLVRRPEIMSRPVSYIEYEIEKKTEEEHEISFYFDIMAECAVDHWTQEVEFGRTKYSLYAGNKEQNVLGKSGDDICIDWGYLHLVHDNAKLIHGLSKHANKFVAELDENKTYSAYMEYITLCAESEKMQDLFCVAFDEINPIQYFGDNLKEYYTKYFDSFEDLLGTAKAEYEELKKECIAFEEEVMTETKKVSPEYEKLTSLAFRQSVAAHKYIEDTEGNPLFISKECYSNGCAGTLDVTYPSIPLYLKYNPELVKGMLRPIMKYQATEDWKFDFAPHDVGCYPLLNGQVYAREIGKDNELDKQMPVEECGNALICFGAIAKYEGNNSFAIEYKDTLKKWADYLVENGYDPGNQLCTDDFAGHLAHNCNLSLKAIYGIACYGQLFGEEKYIDIAREYANRWAKDALADDHTKLAFDNENTWSLKYNIVWDKLLDFNFFDEEVFEREQKYYLTKLNRYGVPLDNRNFWTKTDWQAWTTVMTDDKEYCDKIYKAMYNMVNETKDRAPFTDWYRSHNGRYVGFQNRSVIGSLFINLLK